jgi:hypothetical protein
MKGCRQHNGKFKGGVCLNPAWPTAQYLSPDLRSGVQLRSVLCKYHRSTVPVIVFICYTTDIFNELLTTAG